MKQVTGRRNIDKLLLMNMEFEYSFSVISFPDRYSKSWTEVYGRHLDSGHGSQCFLRILAGKELF